MVSFDTKAHRLAAVGEDVSVRELIRRILRVPAQGYINIEAGLLSARAELRRSLLSERVGVIMTDGVANTGLSPAPVAARFPRLHVVQVGPEERIGTRTCITMAQTGRGRCYRARTYEELPRGVRRLVRECFR